MRGLTILIATDDVARYRAALLLAAAHMATGGETRLFLNERAVGLLGGAASPDDREVESAGLPTLSQLQAEALGLGVRLIACQSGLALARIAADSLDQRIETGGLVGLMASLGDDRLVMA